jgi:hypothetical protein
MALLLKSEETGTATLEELVRSLDSHGPGLNEDTISDFRDVFQAFLNDRTGFSEFLAREIIAGRFQVRNPWVPSSFVLHHGEHYTIRANLWNPPADPANPRPWEDTLYSYKCAHDHNFAFLTGGFYGPGYVTERFEYDPEETPFLRVGDTPKTLRPLGAAQLEQGSLMLFRESRDVHVQHYPTAASISINILLAGRRNNPQIVFADDNATIARVIGTVTRIPAMLRKIELLLSADSRRSLNSSGRIDDGS